MFTEKTRTVFESPSDAQVAEWAREFATASPFPHLVIDDFLKRSPEIAAAFPPEQWDGWQSMGESYQRGKRYCADITLIPDALQETIIRLNSPRALRMLERITGIDGLIPDPYLEGAGLHASGPGGVLLPHSDFHHHPLGIYRRLNLLIYLNDGWTMDDGAALELFPDAVAAQTPRSVVPISGRAVLFATDDRSVHGFTTPVAAGRERRSIALYYYTATETAGYSGDRTTVWRHLGEHRGWSWVRLQMFRGLLNVSRKASRLAHLADPNRHGEHAA